MPRAEQQQGFSRMPPSEPLLAETLPYAIVTGANQPSIGFRAAQLLASPGHGGRHAVVLACRDEAKGLAAKALIEQRDPAARCVYLHLDLASLESIAAFVRSFTALDGGAPLRQGLSLLVNNAGVGFPTPHGLSADGYERVFATNHLGVMYLTCLLLPALKAAERARVVIVSSSLHDPASAGGQRGKRATLVHGGDRSEAFDLQLERQGAYDSALAYRCSKLMNVMFGYALQRRLRADGCDTIAVNSMCPGFIPASGLVRNAGCFGICFLRYCLAGVCTCCCSVTRTLEDGALCEVLCGVSDVAAGGKKPAPF